MIFKLPENFKIPSLFEKVRNGFTILLRKSFASKYVPEEYKYDPEEHKTKIKIYTTFPQKLEFFPLIVTTISDTDFSVQYLQDEESIDENGMPTYFGKIEFTLDVTIKTRSIKDRDRIVDILLFFLRILGKNFFRSLGIEYFKNLRVSEESIEIVNEMPVYTTTIAIPCYTEYEITISPQELENILDISVQSVQAIIEEDT
ncbi:MAG: hypothetical protein QXD43_01610 [Candidatus Aenigmatarchaeota archaeon]